MMSCLDSLASPSLSFSLIHLFINFIYVLFIFLSYVIVLFLCPSLLFTFCKCVICKLGQHLGSKTAELGHFTMLVPGDNGPVTIVISGSLLEGKFRCFSILLDTLNPAILSDWNPILVPSHFRSSGHLSSDFVRFINSTPDVLYFEDCLLFSFYLTFCI